tara:strand:- start:2117 stop:2917 length:801 start_codon:yes stop_codon:yes gene_type:complete
VHDYRVKALSEVNDLISHARSFNSGFKHFLASHDSLILFKQKSDVTQNDRDNLASWHNKSLELLVDHQFERTLDRFPAYQGFKDKVHRVSLNESFQGVHDDDLLLKIFMLRIIAGALEMHSDPLRAKAELHVAGQRKAVDAQLGTLIKPDKKTIATAKRLIRYIKESGAKIDWMRNLEAVASGEAFPTIKKTSPIKALVREISLLSKMLLNTSNAHADRFPISAIQHILELVNEDISDEGIRLYQEQFDHSDDNYLSSGRPGHPTL